MPGPGSHDLSVENLRLHERIVEKERHKQSRYVVKTVTEAPSVRPPAKPKSLGRGKEGSRQGSKAGSKTGSMTGSKAVSRVGDKAGSKTGSKAHSTAGSKHETLTHDKEKEILIVTVIEDDDDEEIQPLPPKAPSTTHTRVSNSKTSKKAPASHISSKHSHHSHSHRNSKDYDLYHIPPGIPLLPGFSRSPEDAELHNLDVQNSNDMALVKVASLPAAPAKSLASGTLPEKQIASSQAGSHHSKTSHHSKAKISEVEIDREGRGDFKDIIFEEVHEVTRTRYVVKVPRNEIAKWKF